MEQTEQNKILLDLIQLELEIKDIHQSWTLAIKELDLLALKKRQLSKKTDISLLIWSIIDLQNQDIITLNIEKRL